MPGIGVFHLIWMAFSASQLVGGYWPSARPEAFIPPNEGHFFDAAVSGFFIPAATGVGVVSLDSIFDASAAGAAAVVGSVFTRLKIKLRSLCLSVNSFA